MSPLVSSLMFVNVGEIYSQKQILMKRHKITDMRISDAPYLFGTFQTSELEIEKVD